MKFWLLMEVLRRIKFTVYCFAVSTEAIIYYRNCSKWPPLSLRKGSSLFKRKPYAMTSMAPTFLMVQILALKTSNARNSYNTENRTDD
jgi:hypothetical protein